MNTRYLGRCIATAPAIMLLITGCVSDRTGEVGSLGSAAAVVACSDHVFWGTVEATVAEADGLHVTFQVDEWVRPASGASRIVLTADDPSKNVGAPHWTTTKRVLVLDGRDSPLDLLEGEVAEKVVAEWEQAMSTISCPDNY